MKVNRLSLILIIIVTIVLVWLSGYAFGQVEADSQPVNYVTLYNDDEEIRGSLKVEMRNNYAVISTRVYSYTVKSDDMRVVFCGK